MVIQTQRLNRNGDGGGFASSVLAALKGADGADEAGFLCHDGVAATPSFFDETMICKSRIGDAKLPSCDE